MAFFSVAIPTYNGEDRLPQVLTSLLRCGTHPLLKQLDLPSFDWEAIVVDNNSTDSTAQVVQDYQRKWLVDSELRYCFEPEQGAGFARQRAVEEARGQLIGFLDDDNLPAADWLAQAVIFAQTHPQVGAFGSQIHAKFEKEPQFDIQKLACFLAIIERGDEAFCYQPYQKILPPTAGLVVRRQAWLECVPKRLVLNYTGREGSLASEDLEALLYMQQKGWEIWYNPDMQIEHYLPAWRLEKDALIAVVRRIGLSRHHLRMMRLQSWQKPGMFILYLLNDLRKLLWHQIRYANKIKGDIVLACERELLKCSCISPFYIWKENY